MKIHPNRQSQFELFPGASNKSSDRTKPRFFMSKVTFSFENFIVLGIVIIMGMIMSFSWGVDRGFKRVSLNKTGPDEPVLKNEIDWEPDILVAAVIPVKETVPSIVKEQASKISKELEVIGNKTTKSIEKVYTIQVASFKTEEYAQKEAMALKKEGYEIIVIPKGDYSIVCVGKFSHYGEAKLFSGRLKKRYKDCLVRSL